MIETLYVHDLAAKLNTTEAAVRSALARATPGTLPPHFRRGKRIAWRASTVEKWLEDKENSIPRPKPVGRPRAIPRV